MKMQNGQHFFILAMILLTSMACLGSQPSSYNPSQDQSIQTTSSVLETQSPRNHSTPVSPTSLVSQPTHPGVSYPTFTPIPPPLSSTLPSGRASLNNVWVNFDTSGFRFDTASIVSWGSKQGDILASSRDENSDPLLFFLQNDSPPYQGEYDQGALSGIIEMPQTSLDQVTECPISGYQYHWVEAKINAVYCVRTRDGAHYAKIQVFQVLDSLVFDWVFRPDGGVSFIVDSSVYKPEPYTYSSIEGDSVTLYPYIGRYIAFLIPSSELDYAVLRQIVNTLDNAYLYYQGATGRVPKNYLSYNGLVTIAVVPSTCGAGCGYLGLTGIELKGDYFERLYNGVRQKNQYDQVIFYEMGRNFWFYENKIEYKDADRTGSVMTGYAVFMRFMAMEATGVAPSPYNNIDFSTFKSEVLGLYQRYAEDGSLNWKNTLKAGKPPDNQLRLGGSDLFAAILFNLRNSFGNEFIQRIWKEVEKRPDAVTTQEAVDNFILAACAAANQNLARVFTDVYRWPVSSIAKEEAIKRFGDPIQP